MLLLFSCKNFGGFSADKVRRRLRRTEKFMADIWRTKVRRAAPAEGSASDDITASFVCRPSNGLEKIHSYCEFI
jgi:hypothetical protein